MASETDKPNFFFYLILSQHKWPCVASGYPIGQHGPSASHLSRSQPSECLIPQGARSLQVPKNPTMPQRVRLQPLQVVSVDLATTSRPGRPPWPQRACAAHPPPGLGAAPTWYSSTCCSAFNLSLSRRSSARESKTGSGTASRSSDVLKSI